MKVAEAGKNEPRWRFVYLLNVAQRRIEAAIRATDGSATAARGGLLMSLPDHGAPMGDIGRRLDLGSPALSGLIERMTRSGLIERRPDPADGRAWIIVLTEAGGHARRQAVEHARQLNDRLVEGFSEDELETVARWLNAVRERFPKEGTR